jgi:hypothetical protein
MGNLSDSARPPAHAAAQAEQAAGARLRAARPQPIVDETLQELALVTALARRIYLDLCHSLNDIPEVHPILSSMKKRCEAFGAALGDTAAYRHELHDLIDRLKAENAALRLEILLLREAR